MVFKYRPPDAPPEKPRDSCSKVSYDSKGEAVADAKYMKENSRTRFDYLTGQKLRPYECHICRAWHLTSSSKSRNHKLRQTRQDNREKQKAPFSQ